MDFFNKITKKASETYKSAAEKTGKIANETKLKIKINDCKSKIENVYTEIGKKVYQKHQLNGDLDIKDDIKEELQRIDELNSQIRSSEDELLKLSDMKQCVKCKNKIEKNAKFCPTCGAEQPEEVKEEVIEVETINTDGQSEQNQEVAETENTESQENAGSQVNDKSQESNNSQESATSQEEQETSTEESSEETAKEVQEIVSDVTLEEKPQSNQEN